MGADAHDGTARVCFYINGSLIRTETATLEGANVSPFAHVSQASGVTNDRLLYIGPMRLRAKLLSGDALF
jgi:hypothetical protein